jgi:integrase
MTPHQFRHFAATAYLEEHPEDFETVRSHLGHAWAKTTRIYAGNSTRRSGRKYGDFLMGTRERLRIHKPAFKSREKGSGK